MAQKPYRDEIEEVVFKGTIQTKKGKATLKSGYEVVPGRKNRINLFRDILGKEWQKLSGREWLVIRKLGVTDLDGCALNIHINSTEYYVGFDGSEADGLPGGASPASNPIAMDPTVYILPGQNFEFVLSVTPEEKDRTYEIVVVVDRYCGKYAKRCNEMLFAGRVITQEAVKKWTEEDWRMVKGGAGDDPIYKSYSKEE
jgi:hypothetical protein